MSGLVSIVLAAGHAIRFGGDKMQAPLYGMPLIAHAIRAARAAPVRRVLVVTRPGMDIGVWAGNPAVQRLPLASTALSDSLKAGIAAAKGHEGAFVFLGDMPRIPHGIAARLAAALGDAYAAVPQHAGRRGHPVLLSARAFADIAMLSGDRGAGLLLADRNDVAIVDCDDPAIHIDVDTPGDMARIDTHPADVADQV